MSATIQLPTGRAHSSRAISVVLVAAALFALTLHAQAGFPPPVVAPARTTRAVPTVLTPADRERVLAALVAALRERYIPEIAERVIAGLGRKAGEAAATEAGEKKARVAGTRPAHALADHAGVRAVRLRGPPSTGPPLSRIAHLCVDQYAFMYAYHPRYQ